MNPARTGVPPSTPAWRPQAHLTAPAGWINDPNGLLHLDGVYHAYFQHNPNGDQWGDLSWGHASSRDLVRWTPLPVALPADATEMVFSGSAVVDRLDTGGFGAGDRPPVVAVYTSGYHPTHPRYGVQAQSLAISLDGGLTFERYSDNPVLDEGLADFRDPKVFWYQGDRRGAEGHWVMVVAEPAVHRVAFYTSSNLTDWSLASRFGPAGAVGGVWECPDLLRTPVDGGGEGWVLLVSVSAGGPTGGSGTQYLVGSFDGHRFVADDPRDAQWLDHGHDYYAGVGFNDTPGPEPVTMAWASSWQYAERVPTSPWRGSMGLPRRLRLRVDHGRRRLRQRAVLPQASDGLLLADIPIRAGGAAVALTSARGDLVRVVVDPAAGTLVVDRSRCGPDLGDGYATPVVAPLPDGRPRDLRVVLDASILEVVVDEELTVTEQVFPASPLTGLALDDAPTLSTRGLP